MYDVRESYSFYNFSQLSEENKFFSKDTETIFGKIKNKNLETLIIDEIRAKKARGYA